MYSITNVDRRVGSHGNKIPAKLVALNGDGGTQCCLVSSWPLYLKCEISRVRLSAPDFQVCGFVLMGTLFVIFLFSIAFCIFVTENAFFVLFTVDISLNGDTISISTSCDSLEHFSWDVVIRLSGWILSPGKSIPFRVTSAAVQAICTSSLH